MKKEICENCGGWKGLHHYANFECPAGGMDSNEYGTGRFYKRVDPRQAICVNGNSKSRWVFETLLVLRVVLFVSWARIRQIFTCRLGLYLLQKEVASPARRH